MQLPIAIASTATERAARRRRTWLAMRAGLLAAGALWAAFLVAPVPRWCLDLLGAPRAGVARFGGLRAVWLAREADAGVADLQRRLAHRGLAAMLHAQGPLVIVEIPGIGEVDTPRVLALLRGPGAVEIHPLGPGGELGRRMLFDQAQIREAAVTSHITGDNGGPTVAFLLWAPDPQRGGRLCGVRVAITVDHDVRWTARLCKLLGDLFVLDAADDLAGLAEALDGGALHGGTIVYAAYVPQADLAPLAWGRARPRGGHRWWGRRAARQPVSEAFAGRRAAQRQCDRGDAPGGCAAARAGRDSCGGVSIAGGLARRPC